MGQQHDFYLVQTGNLVPRSASWRGFLACFQQPNPLRSANLDSSGIEPSDGGGFQSCVVAEVTVSKQALGPPGWGHAKPHHLMRQLHALRRSARRPLRVLVGELRKRHYRHGGRLKSKSSNKNFFADGLCLLVLALDRPEALVWEPSIKERWRRWADEARTQNPLIFHAWEERYQQLQPRRRAAQLALTKAAGI